MKDSRQSFKIVVTGGHHTPALAVLEALQEQLTTHDSQLTTVWVGHRFSMAGDRNESLEYKEVKRQGIDFIDFKSARFHRANYVFFGLRFAGAFWNSFRILRAVRPDLILSFGGYLSAPIVLAGWFLKIPVLSHEQTAAAGFANRFNAHFSKEILISFESSRRYFPKEKVVFTGNPLRREIFEDRRLFSFEDSGRPTLYVTGGKQGSHKINLILLELLPGILSRYNVIHQSGATTLYKDFENLNRASLAWPQDLRKNYLLRDHFETPEIGSVLARADLVISRAGANTVYELAALRKKSILIPLWASSHGEQEKNARLLEDLGLAEILTEGELSPERLVEFVKIALEKRVSLDEEKIDRLFPPDGGSRVATEVLKFLKA